MSERVRPAVRDLFPEGVLRHADFNIEVRCVAAGDRGARGEGSDEKLFEVAVASEAEIEREFGLEILSHERGAVDLTRLRNGAAVLVDHRGDQVGVVEPGSARIDSDRVLRARLRFSKSARGREIEQDVVDGIRKSISVGYFVKAATLVEQRKTDGGGRIDVWRVTRWVPAEVSLVSLPADVSVGVGRSEPAVMISRRREMEHQTTTGDARAEAAEIAGLCDAHGVGHGAAEWIGGGLNADEVSARILESKRTKPFRQPAAETLDGLNERDRQRYSYVRAIALAAGDVKGGIESEVSTELERRLPAGFKRRGGVLVPFDLRTPEGQLERRTLSTIQSGKGGEVVFEQMGEIIELLRTQARVVALGGRVLTDLSGPVAFPRQTGGMQLFWVGENPAADVPASDIALGLVNLVPKSLQGTTSFSRQLMTQASLDVEAMVRSELAEAHARAVDRAILHGEGTAGEPTGIYKSPDVNVQMMGGVPTFGKLMDMAGSVADDNAAVGSLGFITTPLMAAKLMQTLVAASAGSEMIWTDRLDEGLIAGFRAVSTNQVSKTMSGSEDTGGTEHGIVFGNWADVVVGLFGSLEIITDPFAQKKKGLIEVTSFQMCDVILRHGESFTKATGATTS